MNQEHTDQKPQGARGLDETNAAEYAETSARGTIDDLRALIDLYDAVPQYDMDRLSSLGIENDPADDPERAREEADERLVELPLAVEAATTFEVVLGIGGPDRRLCFECTRVEKDPGQPGFLAEEYEIRRVFYRYSWEGSAEVELYGDDRETAEAFGRRVVPELGE